MNFLGVAFFAIFLLMNYIFLTDWFAFLKHIQTCWFSLKDFFIMFMLDILSSMRLVISHWECFMSDFYDTYCNITLFTHVTTVQQSQCLPFYIINEVGHLTTSVDHLAEFCQNDHLAAICTQLMVKFFLQLRFIQYFDCKCMKIPDFSRIDSHFVA